MPIRHACVPARPWRIVVAVGRRGGRHRCVPAAMATRARRPPAGAAPAAKARRPVTVPAPGCWAGRDGHREPHDRPGQPGRRGVLDGLPPELGDPAGEHRRLPGREHREPGPRLPVPRRPTRPAPATATARRGSAASRRPTTTEAVPAVPAFTYPGQTDPFDATPDGPGQLAGQRHPRRRHRRGHDPALHQARVRGAWAATRRAPCSIVVVPNYGRPQGAPRTCWTRPWAWALSDRRPAVVPPRRGRLPADGRRAARRGQPRSPPTCWRRGAARPARWPRTPSPSTTPPSASRRPAGTWRPATTRRRPRHRPARRGRRLGPRRRLRAGQRHGAGGRVPDRRRRRDGP